MKTSITVYAKSAGILLLISILAGVFGEIVVLSKLVVSGNANATAANIRESNFLFRFGFASYLVEAICDVILILLFYELLKPVSKNAARLTILFGLVSMITFAFTELFYIATPFILHANFLSVMPAEQVNSLAMLSLKLYGYGNGVFMLFYGIATGIRGYLIFRAGYLPKVLGILLMLGGTCFVIRNFLLVLVPSYASDLLLLPTGLGMIALALWLLIKGVNMNIWNAKVQQA